MNDGQGEGRTRQEGTSIPPSPIPSSGIPSDPISPARSLPVPSLMLVTEPVDARRLIAIVQAAVAGGVDLVQLRDKTRPWMALLETATALKSLLPDVRIVVNGWQATEGRAAFDGFHLPEWVDLREVEGALGGGWLFGRSVHSVASAVETEAWGMDYLVAGTIFASASHPGVAPAGLELLRQVCAQVRVPVLAIGGVTPTNLAGCIRAGASGVAVLSPIMRADDPYEVARQYRRALDTVWADAHGGR